MATVKYNGDGTVRAFGRAMKTGDTFGGLTDAEAALLARHPDIEIIKASGVPTFSAAAVAAEETPAPEPEAAPVKTKRAAKTIKPKAKK